jgi:hypothetical protein
MNARDINQIVGECAGAVSVCWSEIGSAGIFDSSRAAKHVEEALAEIEAAGYRKLRTITTAAHLEALPFGSAVQTSDASDVVVLRCEGNDFRNQSGFNLSATDLWRYGTRPFTVLYEGEK